MYSYKHYVMKNINKCCSYWRPNYSWRKEVNIKKTKIIYFSIKKLKMAHHMLVPEASLHADHSVFKFVRFNNVFFFYNVYFQELFSQLLTRRLINFILLRYPSRTQLRSQRPSLASWDINTGGPSHFINNRRTGTVIIRAVQSVSPREKFRCNRCVGCTAAKNPGRLRAIKRYQTRADQSKSCNSSHRGKA